MTIAACKYFKLMGIFSFSIRRRVKIPVILKNTPNSLSSFVKIQPSYSANSKILKILIQTLIPKSYDIVKLLIHMPMPYIFQYIC